MVALLVIHPNWHNLLGLVIHGSESGEISLGAEYISTLSILTVSEFSSSDLSA
ncbi:TPA: hypothetical protein VBE23_001993 [Streptococcus agalactiae]|nr:hypothetical protein [Streptococcus agalactiae]HEO6825693.1 hypothetical protein [Streptococcus agalactiae]HEO6835949.1 hypothetical protein [Streptococcus agalactiae]HEO6926279.1 hypothetical protein [Streptococcus agalactiae]HEO6934813.1 hypothetical protein [Streptococcus agalactiae]